MSNQQYRGAQIPDHRADWLNARPPAPVWTENLSCPSSGDARTLLCYAGAGPRYVYRKAKAGEISMSKGRRVETLTGAAYVDQDTLSANGSNITASGNATHLGLPCNYITWPAATHDWASSNVSDAHGTSQVGGQIIAARVDVALSRALIGTEQIRLIITGPAGAAANHYIDVADGLQPGSFYSVVLNEELSAATASGATNLFVVAGGVFASPITIYIRRRMLFDASGLAASECIPDFVDPAVDYGFGAVGVKWLPTRCGNTVDANGVIIPGEGAALPEPMGVAWQPAATNKARAIPSHAAVSAADSPQSVAGLPATRLTSLVGSGTYHIQSFSSFTASKKLIWCVCKPTPGSGVLLGLTDNSAIVAYLFLYSDGTVELPATQNCTRESSRVVPLGNDTYYMEAVVSFSPAVSTGLAICPVNDGDGSPWNTAIGRVVDVAAWGVADGVDFVGTPTIPNASADVSRLADDPATGLPAIGTGPFTAFVHATRITNTPEGTYPILFTLTDGSLSCCMYLYTSGAVYCIHPSGDIGSVAISNGVPFKLIYRRSSTAVAMFVNGVKIAERAETPVNFENSPLFGSIYDVFKGDVVIHDQWLEYSALSDEDCIRVTRI